MESEEDRGWKRERKKKVGKVIDSELIQQAC